MKIIADTATLIAPCQGSDYGITVMPVSVAINNRTYRDYKERFSAADTEILELSPALTTHGGPGCIVIQAICK